MKCLKRLTDFFKCKPETEEEKIRRLDGNNYKITGAGVLSIKDHDVVYKTPRGKRQLEALGRIHEDLQKRNRKILLPK